MSPVERMELSELRREMNDHFATLARTIAELAHKVDSLERTRDQDEAIRADRRQRDQRATSNFRWRLTTFVSIAGTAGLILGSFLHH